MNRPGSSTRARRDMTDRSRDTVTYQQIKGVIMDDFHQEACDGKKK